MSAVLKEGAQLPDTIRASSRPIVVYEEAVRAVQACSTILEAQHWNNKSEALAAWAKIYSDDRVMSEARALKLHAYRQIGRLADQMRQCVPIEDRKKGVEGGFKGRTQGSQGLLIDHGLNIAKARQAVAIGRLEDRKFDQLVSRKTPPSPSYVYTTEVGPNPAWSRFRGRLSIFVSAARHTDTKMLVASMDDKQTEGAKKIIKEAMDYLGELQEQLWKAHGTAR